MVDMEKERRQRHGDREPTDRLDGPVCDRSAHAEMCSRERSDGHERPLYWPL
jgi:hypothetical protein